MGTKNEPGTFDCYDKAEPDEPMFILLARDPLAPILVRLWAELASLRGTQLEKVEEARRCAHDMSNWKSELSRTERTRSDDINDDIVEGMTNDCEWGAGGCTGRVVFQLHVHGLEKRLFRVCPSCLSIFTKGEGWYSTSCYVGHEKLGACCDV